MSPSTCTAIFLTTRTSAIPTHLENALLDPRNRARHGFLRKRRCTLAVASTESDRQVRTRSWCPGWKAYPCRQPSPSLAWQEGHVDAGWGNN